MTTPPGLPGGGKSIDVTQMTNDDFYLLNYTQEPNTMGVVTDQTEAAARALGSGSYSVALVPVDGGIAVVDIRSGHTLGYLSDWAVMHYGVPLWNITSGGKLARTQAELTVFPESTYLQVHMRQNLKELVYHELSLLDGGSIADPGELSRDWNDLLTPDGTPRANLFQRWVTRARVRTASADNSAPRIDYATVGQCERIMQAYGGDPARVREFGSPLLMGLWWILLALLAIVALIGLVTAPVGLIFTALVVGPFVYHYVTRARLEAPFGKQQ